LKSYARVYGRFGGISNAYSATLRGHSVNKRSQLCVSMISRKAGCVRTLPPRGRREGRETREKAPKYSMPYSRASRAIFAAQRIARISREIYARAFGSEHSTVHGGPIINTGPPPSVSLSPALALIPRELNRIRRPNSRRVRRQARFSAMPDSFWAFSNSGRLARFPSLAFAACAARFIDAPCAELALTRAAIQFQNMAGLYRCSLFFLLERPFSLSRISFSTLCHSKDFPSFFYNA